MSIDISISVRTVLLDGEPTGSDTTCVTLTPNQFRRFFCRPEMVGVVSMDDMTHVAHLCIMNGFVSNISVFYAPIEEPDFKVVREWAYNETPARSTSTRTQRANPDQAQGTAEAHGDPMSNILAGYRTPPEVVAKALPTSLDHTLTRNRTLRVIEGGLHA